MQTGATRAVAARVESTGSTRPRPVRYGAPASPGPRTAGVWAVSESSERPVVQALGAAPGDTRYAPERTRRTRALSLPARSAGGRAAPRRADSPLRRPPDGSADAAFGIREFIVGTGGAGSAGFGTIRAGIRLRDFQRRRDG